MNDVTAPSSDPNHNRYEVLASDASESGVDVELNLNGNSTRGNARSNKNSRSSRGGFKSKLILKLNLMSLQVVVQNPEKLEVVIRRC